MIITKIRLQEETPMTNGVTTWPLPVIDLYVDQNAGSNGYLLKALVGIDPPNINAVIDGFDTAGVPNFTEAPEPRDIGIKIGFKPGVGQTVQGLRATLHKLMSRSLLVSFMNGASVVAQIAGYINKFDSGHFSNLPEVILGIKCRTSEFYSPEELSIPLADLAVASPVISYLEGDAPTGFTVVIEYTSVTPETEFVISDYGKFWFDTRYAVSVFNEFRITHSLEQDDILTISTHVGSRRVTLTRDAVDYDLAGYLNGGAVWPKLYPGVNTFDWTFDDTKMDLVSASYIPRFWGV